MPALADLADLVLPRACVGCGRSDGPLCADCRPVSEPLRIVSGGLDVVAAAEYGGAIRAALLRFKERGRRDLAPVLADLLGAAVVTALTDAAVRARCGLHPGGRAVLVPVPSARSVAAARGGDHMVRLARRAAVRAGVRTARQAVHLTRAVRDSAGLDVAERAANVTAAMAASAPPPGHAALLVDDIVTTGSTLREAARALRTAGWPVLGAAVVAATPDPRSTPPAPGPDPLATVCAATQRAAPFPTGRTRRSGLA